ncbi:hypothetical protein Afil01_04150 [Actinorhabdospora filicis]|uniref:HTH cro/C1-type domain-containing protein n=1 Tax=Actinorhabdospora filicis TaxID=1785913 RepID=A0A9W6W752_9ACTN|nr:helix-turn-helix domain-containing protein [Actinorhabdospora filicis]GLZ75608.1 hypothetical protein Afil01_04150 [Actinorhabdospora filicis]
MDIDANVGHRIREARTAAGRSQSELTSPGLLSAAHLSLIESGKRRPSQGVLAHLAGALGTTAGFLASGREPDDVREAERRLAFAGIALHNGSHAEALAEFENLLDEARVRDRAALGRAQALELLGRHAEAASAFEALMNIAEEGGATWAERAVDVMRCYRELGDPAYAADLGERALRAFERLGLGWSDASVRLGVTLAGVYQDRGDAHRASVIVHRMIGVAEELGSPLARASAYWNAANGAYGRGDLDGALSLAERSLALFGETDRLRNLSQLRLLVGILSLRVEPARAREVFLAVRAESAEFGGVVDVARAEIWLAEAALRLGEPGEAVAYATEARDRLAEAGSTVVLWADIALGEAALARGDRAGALERARAAGAVLDGESGIPQAIPARTRLAALYEAAGDAAAAMAAYRAALAATGNPVPSTVESGSARRSSGV